VQSFSVHADGNELVEWLKTSTDAPGAIFVVHGEVEAADVFANRLKQQLGWNSIAPQDSRAFEL
jgi:metallo-beta-lactamase family protein